MTDLDKPLAHEWRFTAPTLATENAVLRSLIAELVGALEPFAHMKRVRAAIARSKELLP